MQILHPFFNLPPRREKGGGAPAARGHGGSPATVGEREEERGNLTPYLDSAEERRRWPAT